jgi:hypothetical protein
MRTPNLDRYVEHLNAWARLVKGRELSLDNHADRIKIAQSLDSSLSPENLTCDGELPSSEVRKRFNHYTASARELITLDPSVRAEFMEVSL